MNQTHVQNKYEIAILAGGCFWGVQELFHKQKGVITTEVGYIGGNNSMKLYEEVKTGKSGHAEAVKITFDTSVTSYADILLYFFNIHDPTTPNQQGNDIGSQYRSEIFYLNKDQEIIAQEVIARVNKSQHWGKPIVTKISAAPEFHKAEAYHQDYLQRHPNGYTCHYQRDFKF